MRFTLCVTPAAEALTVSVYVPAGVGLEDPDPGPEPGSVRLDPHPLTPTRATAARTISSHRIARRRRSPRASGTASSASIAPPREPFVSWGGTALAVADPSPVCTVADIVTVPPRFAVDGVTVQTLFAGAPAHESATLPDRLDIELSSSG